jgi:hypothetical protein
VNSAAQRSSWRSWTGDQASQNGSEHGSYGKRRQMSNIRKRLLRQLHRPQVLRSLQFGFERAVARLRNECICCGMKRHPKSLNGGHKLSCPYGPRYQGKIAAPVDVMAQYHAKLRNEDPDTAARRIENYYMQQQAEGNKAES